MSINNLTESELLALSVDDQAEYVWRFPVSKDSENKWKKSDFPVAKDSKPRFKRRYADAIKKKYEVNGKVIQITGWVILQYWFADARARKSARESRQFVSEPVGAAYWVIEERWENMVITKTEDHKPKDSRSCKCGQPTHGPSYDKCTDCLPYEDGKLRGILADELREYYKKHPEIRSFNRQDSINFIRQHIRNIGK